METAKGAGLVSPLLIPTHLDRDHNEREITSLPKTVN